MANSIAPAYLQGLSNASASNQAVDYERAQDEITRQKLALAEQKRKAGSFWNRAKGLLPAIGAAAGTAIAPGVGTALGSAVGSGVGGFVGDPNVAAPAGISNGSALATSALMAGGKSYLGSGNGFGAADNAVANNGLNRLLSESEFNQLGSGGNYWDYARQFQ